MANFYWEPNLWIRGGIFQRESPIGKRYSRGEALHAIWSEAQVSSLNITEHLGWFLNNNYISTVDWWGQATPEMSLHMRKIGTQYKSHASYTVTIIIMIQPLTMINDLLLSNQSLFHCKNGWWWLNTHSRHNIYIYYPLLLNISFILRGLPKK